MTVRARLDADRTAVPLTRIEHHPPVGACLSPHMPLVNPEHVDENGKRTPLTAPAEKAAPPNARATVIRCLEWLRALATECDLHNPYGAETIRRAARDMAAAFGVEWKQ